MFESRVGGVGVNCCWRERWWCVSFCLLFIILTMIINVIDKVLGVILNWCGIFRSIL